MICPYCRLQMEYHEFVQVHDCRIMKGVAYCECPKCGLVCNETDEGYKYPKETILIEGDFNE